MNELVDCDLLVSMICFGRRGRLNSNAASTATNIQHRKSSSDLSPRGLEIDENLADRVRALERLLECRKQDVSLPTVNQSSEVELSDLIAQIQERLSRMEATQVKLSTDTTRKLDALAIVVNKKFKESRANHD